MIAALTGSGLSAAAGVNAYIPLLLVSLLSRFTEYVDLPSGYDWLTEWWALATMGTLLSVEFFADKIPMVDTVNDVVQTAIRPASGGAMMSATTAAAEIDHSTGTAIPGSENLVVGWVVGIVIALCVHISKMLLRALVNVATFGFGAPLVSAAEDGGSIGLSLAAIFAPILAGIMLLALAFGVYWLLRTRRRRRARVRQAHAGVYR